MAIDPGTIKTGVGLVKRAIVITEAMRDGPSRDGVYEEHYREWIADTAAKLREACQTQEEHDRRVRELESNHELLLILGNFGHEAWREAIDERRRMLGEMAVRFVMSNRSAPELARIERAIRRLDPEDIETLISVAEHLRDMHRDHPTPYDTASLDKIGRGHPLAKRSLWKQVRREGHLAGANLAAAGALLMLPEGHGSSGDAYVTELGDQLLTFLGRDSRHAPRLTPDAEDPNTGTYLPYKIRTSTDERSLGTWGGVSKAHAIEDCVRAMQGKGTPLDFSPEDLIAEINQNPPQG